MRPEAWPGARVWVLAVALCLTLPAGAGSLAGESSSLGEQPSSGDGETDLAAPLVKLATAPSEVAQIRTAYASGQAWGQAQLADEAGVGDAVERLYAALALEDSPASEPVPEAFQSPLAVLVALQVHHAAGSGPFADLAGDGVHAFTLGVLDPVIAAFEEARHEAPEEPVFVDPLGLVVLGGSGDDVYEPLSVGPTEWHGPLLVVEPAGNDTYDVRVAAPTHADRSRLPGPGDRVEFQAINLALELGGNDTYNRRTASADLGGPASQAILVDRHGNDVYGSTGAERTTAYGGPGFAYLLDEEGDDAYRGNSESIAHAYRGGTAVLWDRQGNDAYTANGPFSHAMAHSRQAQALLWDEQGDDTSSALFFAYAQSWNDAVARFLDEQGDDTYEASSPNFGFHNEELAPFRGDSVLDRGLGEFIDGSGNDDYLVEGSSFPQNNQTRVDHRDGHKWGVFIDCETPADADRSCEEEQHQARCTMLRHPYDAPDAANPVVALVLDPVEDECRSAGPSS